MAFIVFSILHHKTFSFWDRTGSPRRYIACLIQGLSLTIWEEFEFSNESWWFLRWRCKRVKCMKGWADGFNPNHSNLVSALLLQCMNVQVIQDINALYRFFILLRKYFNLYTCLFTDAIVSWTTNFTYKCMK